MNVLKIMIVMLVLIMSVGAVCAAENVSADVISDDSQDILQTVQYDTLENTQNDAYSVGEASFTDLSHEIGNATGVLYISQNYKFDNETDRSNQGISINRENFIIEGNGYTIDGSGQSRIFVINANNVTINNLTFINANSTSGGAIFVNPGRSLTTNNVVFENNTAVEGVVYVSGGVYNSNNATFRNNTADNGVIVVMGAVYNSNNDKLLDSAVSSAGVIKVTGGGLNIVNALMMNANLLPWGFIQSAGQSSVTILNSTFRDTTSNYSAAFRGGGRVFIKNTNFINLQAILTAGAIALREFDECTIEDCTFVNVVSDKNGGAIFSDVIGFTHSNVGELLINGTEFVNCSSGFGGALLHFGGDLVIVDSKFIDNCATFDGGAIYVSNSNVTILNSTFDNNGAVYGGERGSFGGAIYCDLSTFALSGSNLTNNCAHEGSAVYLYDSSFNITYNTFENNVNFNCSMDDIFSVFEVDAILDNNTYSGEDSVSTGNVNYATIIDLEGMNLVLINNTIDVTALPSRFDLRDWGWLTPVKNQGSKGTCWTFGSSGAIESAILRFLGIEMDLSENNMEDMSLMYFMYGVKGMNEGNSMSSAANYVLSWFGVFNEEYDVYDQLGKISPIFAVRNSIHIQDIVIIPPRNNATDNDAMKWAILKYGALFINYYAEGSDVDQYYNGTPDINHGVSLVGWDDNREIAGAPDNGAWIIKNSWGTDVGEEGYMYISYYDTSLSTTTPSYAFLLENTVTYNKNYQYDIGGSFSNIPLPYAYRNTYVAVDDDLIAAVGTYFNDTNVEYIIKIYVNDELRYVQGGLSPFSGYHTIKLDHYVPIKEGDEFIIEIESNWVPILINSRQHYITGSSQIFAGGEWVNITDSNYIGCIKAYTLGDNTLVIDNNNVSVYYGAGSYFAVKVVTADGHAVGAGADVQFSINGRNVTATTDDEGIAKVKITDVPGTYDVTTAYNGVNYNNKVTVKLNLNTCKLINNRNIVVDYLGGKYFSVKVVSADGKVAAAGATVKFTINGRTVTAKTDKSGIAKIKITDAPKKYLIVSTFNGKSVKNYVTVRHIVKTTKVTVKKTAKTFTLKAVLKINGKAQKGKTITFKFNGKTYKVKTNAKGIAQKTFNKNVIAKLAKGKTYVVQVSYLKDIVKSTVRVV